MTTRILAAAGLMLSLSFGATASECEVALEANDMMQFSTKLISVPASCEEVSINLKHTGKSPAQAMGHNVVITDTANVQAVGTDGMAAGLDNNYVKPGDERVYAASKVIGGGETTTLTFKTDKLSAGGDYTFLCTFPGHWAIMQGKFEFK
ncbi:azurin [Ferrimonas sp. SCSIO 43195]|uniref:azurin n=1 Tax=Ferrimonas sp. SCSIO 43195 TaxID=2822844 RepID=UPI002075D89E|nr:azurin [Ferrimonas sp. SCSIO 43195]USD36565.1 azurin [Ferrimonas sp. SCSIO 43195]